MSFITESALAFVPRYSKVRILTGVNQLQGAMLRLFCGSPRLASLLQAIEEDEEATAATVGCTANEIVLALHLEMFFSTHSPPSTQPPSQTRTPLFGPCKQLINDQPSVIWWKKFGEGLTLLHIAAGEQRGWVRSVGGLEYEVGV